MGIERGQWAGAGVGVALEPGAAQPCGSIDFESSDQC